jgi:hypothetical protein
MAIVVQLLPLWTPAFSPSPNWLLLVLQLLWCANLSKR